MYTYRHNTFTVCHKNCLCLFMIFCISVYIDIFPLFLKVTFDAEAAVESDAYSNSPDLSLCDNQDPFDEDNAIQVNSVL